MLHLKERSLEELAILKAQTKKGQELESQRDFHY